MSDEELAKQLKRGQIIKGVLQQVSNNF